MPFVTTETSPDIVLWLENCLLYCDDLEDCYLALAASIEILSRLEFDDLQPDQMPLKGAIAVLRLLSPQLEAVSRDSRFEISRILASLEDSK